MKRVYIWLHSYFDATDGIKVAYIYYVEYYHKEMAALGMALEPERELSRLESRVVFAAIIANNAIAIHYLIALIE